MKKWSLDYQKVIKAHLLTYLRDSSESSESSDSSDRSDSSDNSDSSDSSGSNTVVIVVTKQLCTPQQLPS